MKLDFEIARNGTIVLFIPGTPMGRCERRGRRYGSVRLW